MIARTSCGPAVDSIDQSVTGIDRIPIRTQRVLATMACRISRAWPVTGALCKPKAVIQGV